MKKSILLLACAAALASCTVTQKTAVTAPVTDVSVRQYPTVADLEVKPQKVERTETWPFVPFNWGQPTMKVRKGNMVADLLAENGADVLLEPQTVFTKRFLGPRKLTVTGYAATFSNFRKATKEDLEALDMAVPAHEKKVYNLAQRETAVAMGETDSPEAEKNASKKTDWKLSVGWTASRVLCSTVTAVASAIGVVASARRVSRVWVFSRVPARPTPIRAEVRDIIRRRPSSSSAFSSGSPLISGEVMSGRDFPLWAAWDGADGETVPAPPF